jgi:hypothetical protein
MSSAPRCAALDWLRLGDAIMQQRARLLRIG